MLEVGGENYKDKEEGFKEVIDKSITLLITLIEGNDDDKQTIKLLCDNIDVQAMKKKLVDEYSFYVKNELFTSLQDKVFK